MFDKIYVINLDKDTDRLVSISEQLNREQIKDFTRIQGVLGKSNIPEDLKKYTSPGMLRFLPKGLVGCGLSHIKAWKAMAQSGERSSLFLEDDAKLSKGFKEKIDTYSKDIPEDFDIIYLGAFIGNDIRKNYSIDYSVMKLLNFNRVKQVKKYSDNVFVPALPLAMHGYILSDRYCKELLIQFEKDKLNYHIDFQILKYNETANSYSVSPSLIGQQDIDVNTSSNANFIFPKTINKVLYIKDSSGIPINYKLSLAHFEVGEVPINGYLYIFSILALVSGMLGYSISYIFGLVMVLFLTDSIQFGVEKETFNNTIVILVFAYVFYVIGRSFRTPSRI